MSESGREKVSEKRSSSAVSDAANGSSTLRAEDVLVDVAVWEVIRDLDKSSFHGMVEAKARLEGGMREGKGKELKTANTDHFLEKLFCHEDQENKDSGKRGQEIVNYS